MRADGLGRRQLKADRRTLSSILQIPVSSVQRPYRAIVPKYAPDGITPSGLYQQPAHPL